jgi:hypothetical protein
MSERVSQIIAAGAARPRPNGIFAADCPLHEGKEVLYLYPHPLMCRPFFICFGCGQRGTFTQTRNGFYRLRPCV